ncbi:hypothetical protein [Mycobacterium sp. 1245111.1]|uniref:hypothetical protein n=1 Tax=Mycobacterium sp. 1245111.1 TaxID=1834073 RepID=UPI0009F1B36E|nr:hypothetical protein [Mycobacterium sp. 1245111.1]
MGAYPAPWIAARSIRDLAGHFTHTTTKSLSCGVTSQDIQRDNDIRAARGAQALMAYGAYLNDATVNEDLQSSVSDLLGDLRHLCDAVGVDWDRAVERSGRDHFSEVRGAS